MKKYVKVTATFDCDGDLIPEYIVWDDGCLLYTSDAADE